MVSGLSVALIVFQEKKFSILRPQKQLPVLHAVCLSRFCQKTRPHFMKLSLM